MLPEKHSRKYCSFISFKLSTSLCKVTIIFFLLKAQQTLVTPAYVEEKYISICPRQDISISETVFVYSTIWNLMLVHSRSCDSSFVMFLRSICNLESSSFMAVLDSAKASTFFWNILDILWSFAHNLLYFFLKFSLVTIARLKIDGSDTTC